MNRYQNKYTSNTAKLIYNLDRLNEIKKGIFRPISLQFALTDNCNLNCPFCSNQKREGYEFTYSEIKNILRTFKTLGAKSVEFTGGEPTLHKNINEIINFSLGIGYSVGLKSNGIDIKKHLITNVIKELTWLRVSLNSLDYIDEDKLDFTNISDYTTLGFSYVYTSDNNYSIFEKLKKYKEKYNAQYVRIIPDNSFNKNQLNTLNQTIGKKELFNNENGFFWQIKDYSIPEKCWMMYLKPFINTDKNIYFCCATQMFERKFIEKYKLCSTNTDDIIKAWMHPKPHLGKICKDGICYFKPHNELIQSMIEGCKHSDFI